MESDVEDYLPTHQLIGVANDGFVGIRYCVVRNKMLQRVVFLRGRWRPANGHNRPRRLGRTGTVTIDGVTGLLTRVWHEDSGEKFANALMLSLRLAIDENIDTIGRHLDDLGAQGYFGLHAMDLSDFKDVGDVI